MKNIGKTVGIIAAIGGLWAAAGYLGCFGSNQLFSNREEINKYKHSITRPHGALGRITYGRKNDGSSENVYKHGFFTSWYIFDGSPYGKHDGLVDKLDIDERGISRELLREEDYKEYKEEFDEADKLLAETRERFKEYFE